MSCRYVLGCLAKTEKLSKLSLILSLSPTLSAISPVVSRHNSWTISDQWLVNSVFYCCYCLPVFKYHAMTSVTIIFYLAIACMQLVNRYDKLPGRLIKYEQMSGCWHLWPPGVTQHLAELIGKDQISLGTMLSRMHWTMHIKASGLFSMSVEVHVSRGGYVTLYATQEHLDVN